MIQSQRIIPAWIPKDRASIQECTETFAFVHELHIDVVDGVFVPNKSWPYLNSDSPTTVSALLTGFTVEVDVMSATPVEDADRWVEAGAQMLVFHVETLSCQSLAAFAAHNTEVSIGVSALNDTPWESLLPYLRKADYVQVMGIAHIGGQGSSFDERCLERVSAIKKEFPRLPISIDGSMNLETIPQLAAAGVDRFVVGSALVQATDVRAQYEKLRAASTA